MGQPLPDVLSLVRSPAHRATFRCIEVKWDGQGQESEQGDLALCLPEHGTHLLFDGIQQRLRLIEVFDTTRLQVRFGGRVFGGAAHAPTFGRVCEAFGPTYPGEAVGGQYPLQYPGVLFVFPLGAAAGSTQHVAAQLRAADGGAGGALPVPLSTPAARIILHHGAAASLAAARATAPPPLPAGGPYWERVEALPCQGLVLGAAGQLLRFGDSPQDVVSELGPPSSTHVKPARAGSAAAPAGGFVGAAADAPDYFYSYSSRGLDVLFCGTSHRVKKLVLHANQPGHPDFGLYSRCNFRVYPAGSWSLVDGAGGAHGEAAADSPLHGYISAGSEGGASMRTAASEASLPTAGQDAGHAPGGDSTSSSPRSAHQLQPAPVSQEPSSGLSAAYSSLVRFIDDALHIDEREDGSPGQQGAQEAATTQGTATAGAAGDAGSGATAAGAAALGRPPRPPTSVPIPAAPPPVSAAKASAGGGSKKKGGGKKNKKERQRVKQLAAAVVVSSGVGGAGDESGNEATDTDASFADSAPSSLASSPGMTSFMASIAATSGGAAHSPAAAPRFPTPAGGGGAAAALHAGYSSEGGSSADFAGKERALENGSAFDGWSDGDDLALLVGGEEGSRTPLGMTPAGGSSASLAEQAQQAAAQRALRVSTAVQTAPGADEAAGAGVAPRHRLLDATSAPADPDSPESYVMADSPALFDESTGAAEYESVPRQRSSGTQTQTQLLSGAPLRGGSGGAGSSTLVAPGRLRRGLGATGAPPAASVGVGSTLGDLQAVFGSGAKPALHTRLGGRHPFGPTHLFAYRGAVFEVLHNGRIATVTLFSA